MVICTLEQKQLKNYNFGRAIRIGYLGKLSQCINLIRIHQLHFSLNSVDVLHAQLPVMVRKEIGRPSNCVDFTTTKLSRSVGKPVNVPSCESSAPTNGTRKWCHGKGNGCLRYRWSVFWSRTVRKRPLSWIRKAIENVYLLWYVVK